MAFQQDTFGQGYSPDPSPHGQKGLRGRVWSPDYSSSDLVTARVKTIEQRLLFRTVPVIDSHNLRGNGTEMVKL